MQFLYCEHAEHKSIIMFLSGQTLESFYSANLGVIIRQQVRIKNNENVSIINEETDLGDCTTLGLIHYFTTHQ